MEHAVGQRQPAFRLRVSSKLWIAVILWIASNVFVTAVAEMATWEGYANYHGIADLCRWDCTWFGTVLDSGYDRFPHRESGQMANWLFHPFLPVAAYPLRYGLGFSRNVSLVLVSKLALLLGIYAFLLLVSDEVTSDAESFMAGALVAFNPYLIYAHAGYSETLYFSFLCLAFYFANRKQWILSGAMAAVVSASRLIGFLFALPYLLFVVRDRQSLKWDDYLSKFVGLLLCPLGTALYMFYLYHRTGDALAQVHIHVAWVGEPPGNPFGVLWTCLITQQWPRVWGVMCIIALLASAYLFKLHKSEQAIFLALSVLISLSGGYYGIARYIWWQPPLLYAIHCALRRHFAWWTIYMAFAAGMASFIVVGWFSGHNFVV